MLEMVVYGGKGGELGVGKFRVDGWMDGWMDLG